MSFILVVIELLQFYHKGRRLKQNAAHFHQISFTVAINPNSRLGGSTAAPGVVFRALAENTGAPNSSKRSCQQCTEHGARSARPGDVLPSPLRPSDFTRNPLLA